MAQASSGIRRKVDDLGRVVIPAGIRRSLNIREGDAVEVSVDGDRVILAKPREVCVFCGREDVALNPVRTRLVCVTCLAALRDDLGAVGYPDRAANGARPTSAQRDHDRPDDAELDGAQLEALVPPDYDPASTTAW